MSESPAIQVCQELLAEQALVCITDPKALDAARRELKGAGPRVSFAPTPYQPARGAHAIALLTDWREYQELDYERIYAEMEKPAFFLDGRNHCTESGSTCTRSAAPTSRGSEPRPEADGTMKRLSDRVMRALKARLPHGVSRRLDLYRYRAQVRRFQSESLNRVPASIEKFADLERIDRLRTARAQDYRSDPESAAKYADHELWLWLNIERAGRLSLHESRPLRILDIGCGPAYFLAATRALGHESYGVDQPEEYFSPVERHVYSELLRALRVREFVSPLLIQRFQGMHLPAQNLDLITAFSICFNRHRQLDEWGVDEWRFFVEDAWRHLRPGGWLHLELNPHPERYGKLRWYDAPTKAYFESVGVVRNNQVRIQRVRASSGEAEHLDRSVVKAPIERS